MECVPTQLQAILEEHIAFTPARYGLNCIMCFEFMLDLKQNEYPTTIFNSFFPRPFFPLKSKDMIGYL